MKTIMRMGIPILFVALCTSALPQVVRAENTGPVLVDKTGAGDKYYVMPGTVRRFMPGYIEAWVMRDFVRPRPAISSTTAMRSDKARFVYDCVAKTQEVLNVFQYRAPMGGGEVVGSSDFPFVAGEMSPVVPESIGEGVLNTVCENAKQL